MDIEKNDEYIIYAIYIYFIFFVNMPSQKLNWMHSTFLELYPGKDKKVYMLFFFLNGKKPRLFVSIPW